MMLRRMMLRRKTDPKTGKHTLCEPARSKRTRTFHTSHFVEIYRKSAIRQARDTRFVRACAVEMHMDMSEEAFVRKLTRKMPDASPAASVSCEPARSKCTWTCHKRHFVRKFTGKMPSTPDTTSIEHRALTPTVRRSVWTHCLGNNMYVSAVSKMFLVPTCRITARPGIGHMVVSVWLFLMLRIKGISASEFPRMLPMDAYGTSIKCCGSGMAAALVRDSYAMLGPPNRARSKLCIVHGQAISFQEAHFVRICGRCCLLAWSQAND